MRSLNTWYHVAGVYNAANQTLSIYVNGTLDNGTLSGTVPSSQSNPSVNVNIGRRSPGAFGGFYFNGIIDEVRIYNRALTQAEIQTDMNTPLGAPPPPPAAPALATPTNGATGVATNPTLTWNASTGATSYRLQVSTDPAFGTTLVDQSNITTTSYALSALAANTTYYWHVNATNTGGTSAYSTAWSFTTVAPPTASSPALATPANGTTGVATNPTLTWNASTGATSYRLQVSTDPAFATTVVDQSNITTTSYAAQWTVSNHYILLACECIQPRRDKCVLDDLELHDSCTSTASGSCAGDTGQWCDRGCNKSNAHVERFNRSDIVPPTGVD